MVVGQRGEDHLLDPHRAELVAYATAARVFTACTYGMERMWLGTGCIQASTTLCGPGWTEREPAARVRRSRTRKPPERSEGCRGPYWAEREPAREGHWPSLDGACADARKSTAFGPMGVTGYPHVSVAHLTLRIGLGHRVARPLGHTVASPFLGHPLVLNATSSFQPSCEQLFNPPAPRSASCRTVYKAEQGHRVPNDHVESSAEALSTCAHLGPGDNVIGTKRCSAIRAL